MNWLLSRNNFRLCFPQGTSDTKLTCNSVIEIKFPNFSCSLASLSLAKKTLWQWFICQKKCSSREGQSAEYVDEQQQQINFTLLKDV